MRRDVITWDSYLGKQSAELYVNEPLSGAGGTIIYSNYDVFISHKGDDTDIAEIVGDVLYSIGVYGYLDRWDPKVDGDSSELEIHIRDVIRATPSILAVVTENTSMSWWVPFELGVARETNSKIATFLLTDGASGNVVFLPSYLKTWPILAAVAELKTWAKALENSRRAPFSSRTFYIEKAMYEEAPGSREIDRLADSGKVRFVG